ncbi:Mu-like prophage major head subunit gpT family protein [Pseudomonas aeruginosa]|uniref:Mu-like prophage major head subunit gpT family protein n=1 Tax=Pseudomonas aeruginosa TaxID=287 RepID=UPI0023E1FFC5|nr:Mu-like prophage major head subunit gpT family protein [Pseudomonas aeruginosa]
MKAVVHFDDQGRRRSRSSWPTSTATACAPRCNVWLRFWQLASDVHRKLNTANFEKVYDAMRNQKADGGPSAGHSPRTCWVVPTTLRSKAKEVVGVQRLANGADNPNFELVQVLDTAWLN